MQLPAHFAITGAILGSAKLAGFQTNPKIALVTLVGGVLIDLDKSFEIIKKLKNSACIPDITGRCRVLHSIFVIPYALLLTLVSWSLLPFLAIFLHVAADSFISAIEEGGKSYPSHSPWKWLSNPFSDKSWSKVIKGWSVTYPPKFNRIYTSVTFLNIPADFILIFWLIYLVVVL